MNKTFFKAIPAVLTALVCSFFATSCNDDDNDTIPNDSVTDFVTLTGVGNGGFTVTACKGDDSPLATLVFSNQKMDTTRVKVGQRFLLQYRTESGQPYQSGAATAYAYRPILNAKLTQGNELTTSHWATYSQEIPMIWRTGNFINIMAICDYKAAPATYAMVVDEETLDEAIPTAYLLYEPDKGVEGSTLVYYSTFDISLVWDNAQYNGLRVVYVDQNSQKRTTTFNKSGSETITPN